MEIGKIIGIGITAVVLATLLKGYRPEIAIIVSVATIAVLFITISPYIKTIMAVFVDISEKIGIDIEYIFVVVKVIGVAYIAQIGADICKDAGESAIGTKIELGGKLIIMALSMPVIYRLLEVVGEVISIA